MMKDCTSIVFTGDIGFDKHMDKKWEDDALISQSVLDFFHSADHVVANVEGAVIDAADNGSHGIFFHSMNPAAVSVLKKTLNFTFIPAKDNPYSLEESS